MDVNVYKNGEKEFRVYDSLVIVRSGAWEGEVTKKDLVELFDFYGLGMDRSVRDLVDVSELCENNLGILEKIFSKAKPCLSGA